MEKFNVAQWTACIQPAPPSPFPALRMVVDPAYTANDGNNGNNGKSPSDESAFAVGFIDENTDLHLVDCIHGRFKGMALADEIVSTIELWKPESVRIERNGNGACDLLLDCITLRAEMREITIPPISTFVPRNIGRAKAMRIQRLQGLIDESQLHIYEGPYIPALMREVQQFDFDSPDNHRRLDSILDSISLLAGF
jgi:hypothetical protein